jgi:hypothetical protein
MHGQPIIKMNQLVSDFDNFANAPKNFSLNVTNTVGACIQEGDHSVLCYGLLYLRVSINIPRSIELLKY